MLAEPRKKVFYSNPRGNLWANDEQKFGQKLLKSMGWKEGRGLGKSENGITENVKASFKFDSQGLGYKRKMTNLIEENNVYEQILSDLAQHHSGKPSANSDGEQASKPKSIVKHHHRSKFIRAKNQSMQSQKDLFCIFPTSKDESSSSSQPESKFEEHVEKSMLSAVIVESKLSIEDYFKQKMQSKLQKANSSSEPKTPVTDSQPDDTTLPDDAEATQLVTQTKHKKKKKKKHKSSS